MALTPQQVMEKYRALPKDLQKALFSSLTADQILQLEQKYALSVEKAGLLAQEIGWVLLGEKRAHDLPQNLATSLGVPKDVAWEIARDVNHTIFFQVRENLKKLHGIPSTEALIPDVSRETGVPPPGQTKPPPEPPSDKTYWETIRQGAKDSRPPAMAGAQATKQREETVPLSPASYDLAEKPSAVSPPPPRTPLEDEVSQLIPIIRQKSPGDATPRATPAPEKAPPPPVPKAPEPPSPIPTAPKQEESAPASITPANAPPSAQEEPMLARPPAVSSQPAATPAPEQPKFRAADYTGHDPYREPIDED